MAGCGGRNHDGMCEPFCTTTTVQRPQNYRDQQRIESAYIVSVSDLIIDNSKARSFPSETHEKSVRMENCTSLQQTAQQQLTMAVSTTNSASVTRGVSTSTQITATVKGSIAIVEATGTASVTKSVSLNTTNTQSEQKTETHQYLFPMVVAPSTAGTARIWVNVLNAEAPFKGTIVVDGFLQPNSDNLLKASDLLTLNERTIPVEGKIFANSSSSLHSRMNATKIDCSGRTELATLSYQDVRPIQLAPSTKTQHLVLPFSSIGSKCYEGPCNYPLDGTRQVCTQTDTGCDDCSNESSATCDAPPPPPPPPSDPTPTPDEPSI